MIRIKDIADRAGVSPTTVSNVIHGKTGRVSKATVEKINRILKEMEYVPSISARMLANNSSGLIGVALGFMKKGNASSFEDPFVSAMLGNLEYQIREHGYYMMLVARHEQDDIMQQALGWNFDGVIAMALKEKEIAELSERLGKPLVTIDQYLPPELGVRSITMCLPTSIMQRLKSWSRRFERDIKNFSFYPTAISGLTTIGGSVCVRQWRRRELRTLKVAIL